VYDAYHEPVIGESTAPVVVRFPLQGEDWVAVSSPADRIPSHGTDLLGQRYAFDFLRTDRRSRQHYHPAGWPRTLLGGVPTRECYAWGAPVHAPFDGEVVRAVDGIGERSRVHPLRELVLVLKNALTFTPARLPAILGNHVLMRQGDLFAGLAHLAPGSVAVREGQLVRLGEVIGRVGHTGNSTTPHLHFQLMDAADPLTARGVPCAFESYEVWRGDAWVLVKGGIPSKTERMRFSALVPDGVGTV
jgi:murein DD-endopeptidase MepM/ murein hydrolase activator NlpD